MSRIGKQPIEVPAGVSIEVAAGLLTVKGPKGNLQRKMPRSVSIKVEGTTATVERDNDGRIANSMHGLTRTLLANMVAGVVTPYTKSLEIQGVGYRAELKGDKLNLQVGLSHDVNHPIPPTVSCKVDKLTNVTLTCPDKELVGRVAAEIRAYRPCEPYKGKGIKYVGERIRRKEGKTGT
jgi:large subunit ribosomal protein L6